MVLEAAVKNKQKVEQEDWRKLSLLEKAFRHGRKLEVVDSVTYHT
jgi:hypothetical protein